MEGGRNIHLKQQGEKTVISIQAETPKQAWLQSFVALYENGYPVEFNGFYRNESAAIEIANVTIELYSDLFPMDGFSIGEICDYLLTGNGSIEHDWSKLYRKRLFEEENHIKNIISLLRGWPDCPRAQVTVWKNNDIERRNSIAPCLQLLWFKIIDCKLHLHVHMRTSDCYGKLLMNFNEFIALQNYVGSALNLESGAYTQFIDSLHFHTKDKNKINILYQKVTKQ